MLPVSVPAALWCKLGTVGNKTSPNLEIASRSEAETGACKRPSPGRTSVEGIAPPDAGGVWDGGSDVVGYGCSHSNGVVSPASGHIFTQSRFQEQFPSLGLSILKPAIAKVRATQARNDIRTFSDSLPDKPRLKVFDH